MYQLWQLGVTTLFVPNCHPPWLWGKINWIYSDVNFFFTNGVKFLRNRTLPFHLEDMFFINHLTPDIVRNVPSVKSLVYEPTTAYWRFSISSLNHARTSQRWASYIKLALNNQNHSRFPLVPLPPMPEANRRRLNYAVAYLANQTLWFSTKVRWPIC